MGGIIVELWAFMRERKKFWLLPILIMMVVFGGLIVLTKGSAIAPFIYTLFQRRRSSCHACAGNLGLLPRQRRRPDRGRRARWGRAGRALHAQEARFGLPAERGAVLPRRGRHQAGRRRLCRLLRQAVPEVRAADRDLSRV